MVAVVCKLVASAFFPSNGSPLIISFESLGPSLQPKMHIAGSSAASEEKAGKFLFRARPAALIAYKQSQGLPFAVPFRVFKVEFLSGRRPLSVKAFLNWVGTSSVFLYETPTKSEPYSIFLLWHELGHLGASCITNHAYRYWMPINVILSMALMCYLTSRPWVFFVAVIYIVVQLWRYLIWRIDEEVAADAFALEMLRTTDYFDRAVEARGEILRSDVAHARSLWQGVQLNHQEMAFRQNLSFVKKGRPPLYLCSSPGLTDWLFLIASVCAGWRYGFATGPLVALLVVLSIAVLFISTRFFGKAKEAEQEFERVISPSVRKGEFDVLDL